MELNNKIYEATSIILKEFPELTKHLDEMPTHFSSNHPEGIYIKDLREYLDSLNELIKTHHLI